MAQDEGHLSVRRVYFSLEIILFIFFDLGQGTQHITTIDHLYQQLADRIRTALDASNAVIFVRDDASGNFNLRISSGQGSVAETKPDGKHLQLNKRAFVVRRLLNLSTPLVIEPREIETWSQAFVNLRVVLAATITTSSTSTTASSVWRLPMWPVKVCRRRKH